MLNRHAHVACLLTLVFLGQAVSPLAAQERPAVAQWNFDGDLLDRSGRGNDAFASKPAFAEGHAGQGLRCDEQPAVVPDSPSLRPAPGLRIECWARIDALGTSWQPLLIKDDEYQLRIDPPSEGGHFSFFLNLGGWEPRVRSEAVAEVGKWYHLQAGWDGREIWLEVDGRRASRARTGAAAASHQPLELGLFRGILDDVRIENPSARFSGVAQWLFEGDLRDTSGGGHDLAGEGVDYAAVPGGKALQLHGERVQSADHPNLQLAPGLQIDCSLFFDELPPEGQLIAIKNGEYQLRVDPAKEGGEFAFFVNLDGWEPRITSEERVVPGRWYRVIARWDGFALMLDVNGRRSRVTRSGIAKPGGNPLVLGGFRGRIDNLAIENPRLPTLQVRDVRQEHAILRAGRPEKLTAAIRNLGLESGQVSVALVLPQGVRSLGPPAHALGAMPTGAERVVEWTVEADLPSITAGQIQVSAAGGPTVVERHPLVFFTPEGELPPSASKTLAAPPTAASGAATYYVDAIAGDNAHAGTSPDAAWKDFARVNGKVLGPGDRLLIRRGSVVRQELTLSARGTADRWAEIGAYGEGARPVIRRNWDIADRCALVRNPDFLRIRSLVVCYAAKGLVVDYTESGHQGLVIEDCIAHHIEGLYRPNSHGIPEWLDREGPSGDSVHNSPGIAICGAPARDLVLRDCETYQCSSGWFVRGDDVLIDRVFCHDNYVHNTSPHPFLVGVRRTVLQNSIFDASGWHASAGTMGIMLGDPQGLVIRNCTFRNQPDSGSHDEGGIDFEARGNGCLVEGCTFENNAGAAIEVLGLKSPQTTNVEIRNSRFIRNNVADKLGPSEIFIWGRSSDPSVCCSTGTVCGNGYVTLPGVEFFINEAPQLTSWALRDNTRYGTVEELDAAMPINRPPQVDAGDDVRTDRLQVPLSGSVSDDAKPAGRPLTVTWEVLEAAGEVTFADIHAPRTEATFTKPGDYLLRLVADDGELWLSDTVTVHVLQPGTAVAAAWEFNRPLDKEGWSEVNPGTTVQQWPHPQWSTSSHPVKYVAGGYYVLAVDASADAHLLSPGKLGVELTGEETLIIRFQNHTPAERMRLRFTTEADSAWNDAKSVALSVVPNDDACRTYALPMSAAAGWTGRLEQLRLDLAIGEPLRGTCRFDYVWILRPQAR